MKSKKTTKFLSGIVAAVILVSVFSPVAKAQESTYGSADILSVDVEGKYGQSEGRKMFDMINEFRTGDDAWQLDQNGNKVQVKGLKPLVYDYGLERAAMLRALESAMSFSHERPCGEMCFSASDDVNCIDITGENIAAGCITAYDTFVQFQETDEDYNGQGHRRNMLSSDFSAVGIGHVTYDGVDFWSQEFSYGSNETNSKPAEDNIVVTTIKLNKNKYIVDDVSCNLKSMDVYKGETGNLPSVDIKFHFADTVAVRPVGRLKNVTWNTSDKNIVEITGDKVKGINLGKAVITPLVPGFSNISGVDVNVLCNHKNHVKVAGKNPTCTESGVKDYYKCNDCGKMFSDEKCTNEITKDETIIPATGHNYGEWIVDKEPTEKEEGHRHKECLNCGHRVDETMPKIPPFTGWKYVSGSWYYYDNEGVMVTDWKYISGSWYYFNDKGVMVTGWKYISGSWYYFNDKGEMNTGWKYIGGSWYYFKDSGVMVTGWKYVSGSWYYFNGSGVMVTGWKYVSGSWYFFNTSGEMITGWAYISGEWYYFGSDGVMLTNTWIDGIYYVDSTGKMV